MPDWHGKGRNRNERKEWLENELDMFLLVPS
jgi:hypothetical protein